MQKSLENMTEVTWKQVKNGDTVFISGNLKNNKPARCYGPHKVYNRLTQKLINTRGQIFPETWPTLFVQSLPEVTE